MTIELRELPFFSQALLAYLALNAGRDRTILRRTVAPAADLGRVLGVVPKERRQITEAVDELLARGFLRWDSDFRLWLSETAPGVQSAPEPTVSAAAARQRRFRDKTVVGPSVYVMRRSTDGALKIGFSENPIDRLRTLQSEYGCQIEIVGYTPGTPADERRWHDHFAAIRIGKTEWFKPDEEILTQVLLRQRPRDTPDNASNNAPKTSSEVVLGAGDPSPSHSPSDLRSGSDLVLFPESFSGFSSDPKELEASARVTAASPKASRKKPERALPSEWKPTETELQLAQKLRLNEPREREKFKDAALAKGRVCADWNAAYRNWLRKSVEFSHIAGKPPGLVGHTEHQQRDEAARLDENARQEHRQSLVDMAEAGSFGAAVKARWEAGELTVEQLEDLWARRRKAGAA
jgi:hypothetical protein